MIDPCNAHVMSTHRPQRKRCSTYGINDGIDRVINRLINYGTCRSSDRSLIRANHVRDFANRERNGFSVRLSPLHFADFCCARRSVWKPIAIIETPSRIRLRNVCFETHRRGVNAPTQSGPREFRLSRYWKKSITFSRRARLGKRTFEFLPIRYLEERRKKQNDRLFLDECPSVNIYGWVCTNLRVGKIHL